ncbi:MAG: sulfatase [Balneolaceae bacterium]|nr:sulfatase [Balneolaceae bacterium]
MNINQVLFNFLLLLVWVSFIPSHSGTVLAQAPEEARPNILFVLSDDQSWPHAGAYGANELSTPAFDKVAEEGVLFTSAFAAAPQCSPNRAAILTGRNIGQLEEAGTHASNFPRKFQVFPELLEQAGYQVGYTGKGWGPGNWRYNNRQRNPAGIEQNRIDQTKETSLSVSQLDYAANFAAFFENRDQSKPFFFWLGTYEPHRSYKKGSGIASGKNPENVDVPSFLPDTPEIRSDILDYFVEIEWFDQHLHRTLQLLEEHGELENTLVVVTSDNGMPFPRAKANLYEYGTHIPLAISWPRQIKSGGTVDALASSIDFFPTFLEAAGVEIPDQVTGKSMLPILTDNKNEETRDFVFTGRERHTHARPDNLGYPARAIRTQNFLYIRNLKADRWPAGNPKPENREDLNSGDFKSFGLGYADIDGSPTKTWMLEHRNHPKYKDLFNLAFGKRPAEELYDIQKDPGCLQNLAGEPEFESVREKLSTTLDSVLSAQNDPRAFGYEIFESYPRYSPMRNFPGFKVRGEYNFEF